MMQPARYSNGLRKACRVVFRKHDQPQRFVEGPDHNYRVSLDYQDGTLANSGWGFETERDARAFEDGARMVLRTLCLEAPHVEPLSEACEERLRRLCDFWQTRLALYRQIYRRYPAMEAKSMEAKRALWAARRYRLALWALGRHADALTIESA